MSWLRRGRERRNVDRRVEVPMIPDSSVRNDLEVDWTSHLLTMPMLLSTVAIRLFASFFSSFDGMSFSSARTTPSLHLIPIDVPPFSTAFTAYST